MTDKITVADIEAATQVVNDLLEQSDQITLEDAVQLRVACETLAKKAKDAAAMLETQAIKKLEGGERKIGRSTFKTTSKPKLVPDQSKVKQRILGYVTVNKVTGARKKITVEDAVELTIDVMYDLFVAPSAIPKAGGLKKLKMGLDEFCTEEPGPKHLMEVIE